mmetsp:Transcript_20006/g.59607  ORF Transcript_20006/g.59607 Transcript_20006/m.59607 type:complete len:232 (+) Transcript_20006:109-804(+)
MMSKILLALCLAVGTKAQLPYNKDSKKFEYDAGDKGDKGCDHVDLLPSKRCNYAEDQDRWGYDKKLGRDMSPAEACPKACGTYKPWKNCDWVRSDSGYDEYDQIGDAKNPDDCIKICKKEFPDATIANINIGEVVEAEGGNAKSTCWCQFGGKPKKDTGNYASCYLGEPDTKKKCKKDDKKWKDSEDGLRCKDIKKSDDRKKMCKKLRGETADGEIVKAYEACCKTCKKYA